LFRFPLMKFKVDAMFAGTASFDCLTSPRRLSGT
jgi:hypothetical protein